MVEYSFVTIWNIDAPQRTVWRAVSNFECWSEWWDHVAAHEQGILGSQVRIALNMPLRLSIPYIARIICLDAPNSIELQAVGRFGGTRQLHLSRMEGRTLLRYDWRIRLPYSWIDYLARPILWLAKQIHSAIMRQGAQGLARHLDSQIDVNDWVEVADQNGEGPEELVIRDAATDRGLVGRS